MRAPRVEVVYKVRLTGRLPTPRIQKLVLQLINFYKMNPKIKKALPPSEGDPFLTVALVSPKASRSLNFRYRKKNHATDVLSFSVGASHQGLGELVLCPQVLRRQAKEFRVSFQKELDYMIIHGFLHLLGYDHEKSRREELKMIKLQDKLFSRFSK